MYATISCRETAAPTTHGVSMAIDGTHQNTFPQLKLPRLDMEASQAARPQQLTWNQSIDIGLHYTYTLV